MIEVLAWDPTMVSWETRTWYLLTQVVRSDHYATLHLCLIKLLRLIVEYNAKIWTLHWIDPIISMGRISLYSRVFLKNWIPSANHTGQITIATFFSTIASTFFQNTGYALNFLKRALQLFASNTPLNDSEDVEKLHHLSFCVCFESFWSQNVGTRATKKLNP